MKSSGLNFRKFPEADGTTLLIRKFNNFRIFWKHFQQIAVLFVPVSKFSDIFGDVHCFESYTYGMP